MAAKYLIVNLGSQTKKYALASEDGEILSRATQESPDDGFSLEQFLGEKKEVVKIGIRIVAPGTFFTQHKSLDAGYLEMLHKSALMWPLHLEPVLRELEVLKSFLPAVPIFALSDSAFHQPLPEEARLFPIDRTLAEKLDLYRFGYHGFSVGSIVRKLSARDGGLPRKLIVAHLGGGVSVTALLEGKTIETSMGFTPFSGVLSSTRVGELDPGALLHLVLGSGLSSGDLSRELETKSGLFALSGGTGEVRDLLLQEKGGDLRAQFVLRVFVNSILKYIAAYIVSLGGADLIVLTGTIAERSELTVQRIRDGLEPLAVTSEKVIILPTDEMGEMAHALQQ
ncbi:hypothetical protein IT398_00805 [Candidatus Nomurabacteria bacterium]|nr:hypothetical protein [Candidatus Nomurabacteria bacterium]